MNKKVYTLATIMLAVLISFSSCKEDDDDKDDTPQVKTPREQVVADYKDVYLATAMSDPGFTGTTVGCNAGACSQTSHDNVIKRINYFRKLVGLPANVTLNASQSSKCQEAALYMVANNTLTHTPSGGLCYTQGAYAAASTGNIAISNGMPGNTAVHSVNAVTGYVEDPGANNKQVGHRAWILQPELAKMGHGSVWITTGNKASNCLMWGDNLTANPVVPAFIAYPPKGFMPGSLVFPRWSFSIPGATFGSANVTMTGPSGNVNLTICHRSTSANGMPDPRIVWEPQGIVNTGMSDITYTVTVSGITAAPNASYTYDVVIIPSTALARYGIALESQPTEMAPNAFREILSR